MKKLRLFLLAGLACMALTACEKDNEEENPGRVKTFGKFVMADTQLFRGEGKVVLDFDGANSKLLYENGDYVKINGEDFRLTKSGSGSSTVWTANGTELTATKFYCAYVDGVNTGSVLTNFDEGGTYRFNLNTRLSQATNKIMLGGVTDSNVLTLRPACAIIRLKANASYSDVKIGFEANTILKEGTMTITSGAVALSGSSYLAAVTNATGTGADLLSMEYNSEGGYWYVAVPVSGSVTTTLYLQWTVGGNVVRQKTSGQVTLTKGYVYDMGTERNSPFTENGYSKCSFLVSEGSEAFFSAGNLQAQRYIQSGSYYYKWQFAEHQYDVIGSSNGTNISAMRGKWFDLFGYATSGFNNGQICYDPRDTSINNSKYYNSSIAGTNSDWGVYIKNSPGIYYGTKLVNSINWRTLTSAEWNYVINRSGKGGLATINSMYKGIVLLPDYDENGDDWTNNTGVPFTAGYTGGYTTNNYTTAQWATLENAGAIFLPVTGYRDRVTVSDVGTDGVYWSTTIGTMKRANSLYFNGSSCSIAQKAIHYGQAVRLVLVME